jgi:hypothetical protein
MFKPAQLELMKSATLIIWDEMLSNHKELYEAAYRATNGFAGKVVLGMGDFRQILPVVPNGSPAQTIDAALMSSFLWYEFTVVSLTVNMRLRGIHQQLQLLHNDPTNDALRLELQKQLQLQEGYAEMILAIGEARDDNTSAVMLNQNQYDFTQIYHLLSAQLLCLGCTPTDSARSELPPCVY